MAKQPRIRKSLSLRDQSETTSNNPESESRNKASGLSKLGVKLSKLSLFTQLFKILNTIFRPFKMLLMWLVPRYFINSWREFKQVTWPSRSETWRLTSAVLIFAIVFGSLVAGVDKVLDEIFKKVILK